MPLHHPHAVVPAASPVAVVLPTRDRPELLDTALRSLRASLGQTDELVVVDSASRDAAAVARVAARHGARLLRCAQPGVDRARNLGWRATTAPLVLFVDDDVTVDPGWADGFRAALREVCFATGRISPGPGSPTRVAVMDDVAQRPLERRTRGTLGHGASMGVRRDALERVGGWDEAMGAGARFRSAPEADLFDRLLAAGCTGRYAPAARAWHAQWRTPRQVAGLQVRYAVGMGARIAKLVRTDRRRLPHALREALWDWGVVALARCLRQGDLPRAAAAVVRFGGYLAGFVLALGVPVRDGHFSTGRGAAPERRPGRRAA